MRSLPGLVLLCTAAVFAVWAVARVVILGHVRATYNYDDRWRAVVTDFEIHTLDPRFGWDLTAVPVLVGVAVLLLHKQSARARVAVFAATTILATVLALGMALFPSAALGGHVGTPLRSYVGQSLAFAACGTALMFLAGIAVDLILRRRFPSS
jgi:hypothetical protein